MSAIAVDDAEAGPIPVIQVLVALHPGFGAQELVGPVEVLSNACHKLKDPSKLSPALNQHLYLSLSQFRLNLH